MRPILKSTKVSAKKPAAAKAKTSNSPSAGKGLPRNARKPASLPKSDGDAGVQAYIAKRSGYGSAEPQHVDLARPRRNPPHDLVVDLDELADVGKRVAEVVQQLSEVGPRA
ncbi:MAG TPA: hypothetical protein VIS96_13325 [Terrimicrobiaceae bacterium]